MLDVTQLSEDSRALIIALDDIGAPEAFVSMICIMELRNPVLRTLRFAEYFSGVGKQTQAHDRVGHTAAEFDSIYGDHNNVCSELGLAIIIAQSSC